MEAVAAVTLNLRAEVAITRPPAEAVVVAIRRRAAVAVAAEVTVPAVAVATVPAAAPTEAEDTKLT